MLREKKANFIRLCGSTLIVKKKYPIKNVECKWYEPSETYIIGLQICYNMEQHDVTATCEAESAYHSGATEDHP